MTIITNTGLNEGISVLGLGGFSVSAVAIFYIVLGMIVLRFVARRNTPRIRVLRDEEILDDDAPYFHKAYRSRLITQLNNWRKY